MSPLPLSRPPVPEDWVRHTPASDPGEFAVLLDAVVPRPPEIGVAARNLIAHYRAQATELPAATREDVHLRWVSEQLATDQRRHRRALDVDRPLRERLQGCCRDHALFAVAVLRQHGVPARSRVGFAGYVDPSWHHDHVVAEYRDIDRWRRFDPEIEPGSPMLPGPTDLEVGEHAPFQTAAEVFKLMRAGEIDPAIYGVAPGNEFSGPPFIVGEVFYELAHRYRDEILLWDWWGAIPPVDQPDEVDVIRLSDEVAELLLAGDAGDLDAEGNLYDLYISDDRPPRRICPPLFTVRGASGRGHTSRLRPASNFVPPAVGSLS